MNSAVVAWAAPPVGLVFIRAATTKDEEREDDGRRTAAAKGRRINDLLRAVKEHHTRGHTRGGVASKAPDPAPMGAAMAEPYIGPRQLWSGFGAGPSALAW
jgi:hypothetical protein